MTWTCWRWLLIFQLVNLPFEESSGNMFYVYFFWRGLVPKQIDDNLHYWATAFFCREGEFVKIVCCSTVCETYSASFAQVFELSHIINLQIYVKYVIISKYTACIYIDYMLWYSHDTHGGKLPCSNIRVVNVSCSRQDLSISPYHMGGWAPHMYVWKIFDPWISFSKFWLMIVPNISKLLQFHAWTHWMTAIPVSSLQDFVQGTS